MKKAPAFDCVQCNRRIGAERTHWLIAGTVSCSRCVNQSGTHDLADAIGTRAGTAWKLGIWGRSA